MGNEQSGGGGSAASASRGTGSPVFTVKSSAEEERSRAEKAAELFGSLPMVMPLMEEHEEGGPSPMLPGLLASILTLKKGKGKINLFADEAAIKRAMEGLALQGDHDQLTQEQKRIIGELHEIAKVLSDVRAAEEKAAEEAKEAARSLNEIDRLMITAANICDEVDDVSERLTALTSDLPDEDPLKSFSTFLAYKSKPPPPVPPLPEETEAS